MCLNRRPIAASREVMKISKGIRKLHEENGKYKGFQLGCDEAGLFKKERVKTSIIVFLNKVNNF